MTPQEQTTQLRHLLHDPALRLPDDLVDLDRVHSTARTRQRRRVSVAAAGAVVVVALVGLASFQPWQDQQLPTVPDASRTPTPTPTGSPAPYPDGGVTSVSAIGPRTWWVLLNQEDGTATEAPTPTATTTLLRTVDGGATFSRVSRSGDADAIPSGTTDVRFLDGSLGWGLRIGAGPGEQVWATSDGGVTWGQTRVTERVLALEAGGGTGWLLVVDGARLGLVPLTRGQFQAAAPIWLGTSDSAAPALTVQGGAAVVLWSSDGAAHTSLVSADGTTTERTNPCAEDLGVESLSASVDGLAVSCFGTTRDTTYGSADGGRTWTPFPVAPTARVVVGSIQAGIAEDQGDFHYGMAAIGGDDGRIYQGLIDPSDPPILHTSIDGKPNGTAAPWRWIGFTDQTSGFAIDGGGRLFHSDQRGTSWVAVDLGPAATKASSASVPQECSAGDLRVSWVSRGEGAGGHRAFVVTVQNSTDVTCTLSGRPGLSASTGGARHDVPLGTTPFIPGPVGKRPAVLLPGTQAQVLVETTFCDHGDQVQQWREPRLEVAGGALVLDVGHDLYGCIWNASPWTLPDDPNDAGPPR